MKIIAMTVVEWIAVEDNPHHRDTDHLQDAARVRVLRPGHAHVAVAELSDGTLIKLDGHTRARKWQLDPGSAPPKVLATAYPVASRAEAQELYDAFAPNYSRWSYDGREDDE